MNKFCASPKKYLSRTWALQVNKYFLPRVDSIHNIQDLIGVSHSRRWKSLRKQETRFVAFALCWFNLGHFCLFHQIKVSQVIRKPKSCFFCKQERQREQQMFISSIIVFRCTHKRASERRGGEAIKNNLSHHNQQIKVYTYLLSRRFLYCDGNSCSKSIMRRVERLCGASWSSSSWHQTVS